MCRPQSPPLPVDLYSFFTSTRPLYPVPVRGRPPSCLLSFTTIEVAKGRQRFDSLKSFSVPSGTSADQLWYYTKSWRDTDMLLFLLTAHQQCWFYCSSGDRRYCSSGMLRTHTMKRHFKWSIPFYQGQMFRCVPMWRSRREWLWSSSSNPG